MSIYKGNIGTQLNLDFSFQLYCDTSDYRSAMIRFKSSKCLTIY